MTAKIGPIIMAAIIIHSLAFKPRLVGVSGGNAICKRVGFMWRSVHPVMSKSEVPPERRLPVWLGAQLGVRQVIVHFGGNPGPLEAEGETENVSNPTDHEPLLEWLN